MTASHAIQTTCTGSHSAATGVITTHIIMYLTYITAPPTSYANNISNHHCLSRQLYGIYSKWYKFSSYKHAGLLKIWNPVQPTKPPPI